MTKSCKLLLLVVSLLICASMVVAQAPPPPPPPPGPGGPPPGIPQPGRPRGMTPGPTNVLSTLQVPPLGMLQTMDLGLTDDQQTKLRDSSRKGIEAKVARFQKWQDANDALRKALLSPDYDAAKVQTLVKQAQEMENALVKQSLDEWAELHSVLTKEQFTKLGDAISRMPRRGFGGERAPMGMGGQAPPPPVAPPPPPQP